MRPVLSVEFHSINIILCSIQYTVYRIPILKIYERICICELMNMNSATKDRIHGFTITEPIFFFLFFFFFSLFVRTERRKYKKCFVFTFCKPTWWPTFWSCARVYFRSTQMHHMRTLCSKKFMYFFVNVFI